MIFNRFLSGYLYEFVYLSILMNRFKITTIEIRLENISIEKMKRYVIESTLTNYN